MVSHLLLYIFAFIGIWIGSGLAIGAVERLSKILRVSSFAISFILLGFFTSVSELSVGINSVADKDPEIFVGNLIGASIVLFMLVVPLLAIMGHNIRISPEFRGFNLPASLIVIALPVLLTLDGVVDKTDSILSLGLYGLLAVAIQKKRNILQSALSLGSKSGIKLGKELIRIIFGVATIFVSSKFVVEQTVYFSALLNVSPFFLSLLLIAIGTNIPELSLVVRSAFMRSNQIAFGDYVGSAAFNTFLLGFLTVLYGQPVLLTNSYVISLLFLVAGLFVFYHFARTKNTISRKEGILLLLMYLSFIAVEIYVHRAALMGAV